MRKTYIFLLASFLVPACKRTASTGAAVRDEGRAAYADLKARCDDTAVAAETRLHDHATPGRRMAALGTQIRGKIAEGCADVGALGVAPSAGDVADAADYFERLAALIRSAPSNDIDPDDRTAVADAIAALAAPLRAGGASPQPPALPRTPPDGSGMPRVDPVAPSDGSGMPRVDPVAPSGDPVAPAADPTPATPQAVTCDGDASSLPCQAEATVVARIAELRSAAADRVPLTLDADAARLARQYSLERIFNGFGAGHSSYADYVNKDFKALTGHDCEKGVVSASNFTLLLDAGEDLTTELRKSIFAMDVDDRNARILGVSVVTRADQKKWAVNIIMCGAGNL